MMDGRRPRRPESLRHGRTIMIDTQPTRDFFWRYVVAEVRKIYDFRFPQISSVFIFLAVFLFVIQIYYVEHVPLHRPVPNAYYAVTLLYYVTWSQALLIFLFFAAFSVYCVTVESQYGMVRVLCAQPLARWQYVAGKYAAILCHVALLATTYVISLLIWGVVQSGVRGMTLDQWLSLLVMYSCVLIYTLAIAWISISVALLRKTMISSLVAVAGTFAGLGLMTTYRSLEWGKYYFIRYYFMGLENLPMPFRFEFPRYPFTTFCLVTLATCLIFAVPPLLYFHFRDITE
jgi:ABC-type transport system involved in multi-copper enzyme maturation permease subunit